MLQQIVRAHARRQQRLMRIAHRRVGEQQPLLLADPLAEFLRPQLQQLVPRARRRFLAPWDTAGSCGSGNSFFGSTFPFTSGRPLMITSPR